MLKSISDHLFLTGQNNCIVSSIHRVLLHYKLLTEYWLLVWVTVCLCNSKFFFYFNYRLIYKFNPMVPNRSRPGSNVFRSNVKCSTDVIWLTLGDICTPALLHNNYFWLIFNIKIWYDLKQMVVGWVFGRNVAVSKTFLVAVLCSSKIVPNSQRFLYFILYKCSHVYT